jgi:ketosteroid isomerase-like protein
MPHLKTFTLLALAFCLSTAIQAQTYIGKDKDIQIILKNIKTFSQYYMDGDIKSLTACYTTDGKIFPGGSDIIEGLEAIEQKWALPEGVKILLHKVTPSEIRIVKNYAYDYGYYEGETLKANGEKVSWKGKYVIVWRKVGKEWKIYLDIWNNV